MIGAAQPHSINADDASQAEALKARSEAAWSQLYDVHYQQIFRYVLARTSDVQASEDIAAEVFLQALKSISTFKPQGRPVLAWLYGIARNVVADHYKAAKRKKSEPLTASIEDSAGVTGLAAEAGMGDPASQVARLDVRAALVRLKESHREVIALHYYGGLTLPEAAVVMGKKERAVYSLHERAIDALAREMRRSGE